MDIDTMISTYNTAVTDTAGEILEKERRRKMPLITRDILTSVMYGGRFVSFRLFVRHAKRRNDEKTPCQKTKRRKNAMQKTKRRNNAMRKDETRHA